MTETTPSRNSDPEKPVMICKEIAGKLALQVIGHAILIQHDGTVLLCDPKDSAFITQERSNVACWFQSFDEIKKMVEDLNPRRRVPADLEPTGVLTDPTPYDNYIQKEISALNIAGKLSDEVHDALMVIADACKYSIVVPVIEQLKGSKLKDFEDPSLKDIAW